MMLFARVTHWLLGWDWVLVSWGFGEWALRRVRYAPNGRPFVMLFGEIQMMDMPGRTYQPLTFDGGNKVVEP